MWGMYYGYSLDTSCDKKKKNSTKKTEDNTKKNTK